MRSLSKYDKSSKIYKKLEKLYGYENDAHNLNQWFSNEDIDYATANAKLTFKPNVPTYLIESKLKPGHALKFNATVDKINYVCIDFTKEKCTATHFDTLFDSQLDQVLFTITQNPSYSSLPRAEKIDSLKFMSSEKLYTGVEHSFKNIDMKHKQTVKYFLKNIECYAGIKFVFDSQDANLCSHHVSICSSPMLFSHLNRIGSAQHALNQQNKVSVDKSLLLIDSNSNNPTNDPKIIGEDYIANTIGHELLHTLGLEHPEYKNLKDQLLYRSLVANEDSEDSALAKSCVPQARVSLKKYAECMNPPVDLQPVDVKGLNKIWGYSQDYSQYCNELRSEFTSMHQNLMLDDGATL